MYSNQNKASLFRSDSPRVNVVFESYIRGEDPEVPLFMKGYPRLSLEEAESLRRLVVHSDLSHSGGQGMTNDEIMATNINYQMLLRGIMEATKDNLARYSDDPQSEQYVMLANQVRVLSDLQASLGSR